MTIKVYLVINPDTGEIYGHQAGMAEFNDHQHVLSPTGAAVAGSEFYVHKGQLRPRHENPTTQEPGALRNVPYGAQIRINHGDVHVCHDGVAELEFTYPGTYSITVECFPFKPAAFEVVV